VRFDGRIAPASAPEAEARCPALSRPVEGRSDVEAEVVRDRRADLAEDQRVRELLRDATDLEGGRLLFRRGGRPARRRP
jgi:hypothetical protein